MTAVDGALGRPVRVAVIGTGPAGFYAAAALLKQEQHAIEIDLIDRLPTPYGLVRGGVAPDHPKIKSVIRVYEKQALQPGVRFFGNVEVGRDVEVPDLMACYDQIVYALGNESDRRMGIPGEELYGCTPATVFVGWYNAHPDYRDADLDLGVPRVAVVGNGNVAVDVARILARDVEELRTTDIAEHALAGLSESRVEEIVMLGRRGPVQAAFTPQELKELTELGGVDVIVDPAELELDPASRAELEASSENAACRRNYEILREVAERGATGARRRIRFRFLVSPTEILGDDSGRVRGVRLERNRLEPDGSGGLRARGTGTFEELEVGWVFVSIGYQGRPIPGIPFDRKRGVIANQEGRVVDPSDWHVVPNQYAVGWAALGPRGLIGIHKSASSAVVDLMLRDIAAGTVVPRPLADLEELLRSRSVQFVTFGDWQRIDAAEIERGRSRGAPRSKFASVDEMLQAARADEGGSE